MEIPVTVLSATIIGAASVESGVGGAVGEAVECIIDAKQAMLSSHQGTEVVVRTEVIAATLERIFLSRN